MFYAYMLRCKDGSLYSGSTNDIEKRLIAHNTSKSGAKYTRARRPVKLAYKEKVRTFKEARAREAAFKRLTRTEKLLLTKKRKSLKNKPVSANASSGQEICVIL